LKCHLAFLAVQLSGFAPRSPTEEQSVYKRKARRRSSSFGGRGRPVGTIFEPLFGGFEEIGFRKKLLIPAKYGG